MRLSITEHADGARVSGPNRVVYDVAADAAHAAPAQVQGRALVWELAAGEPSGALLSVDVLLAPTTEWLMRCDRVDFGPGGIAYRHTHPGPGTRYLLFGEITIDSEGAEHTYGPGQPWFERGPDPVLAITAADAAAAGGGGSLVPLE